MKIIIKETEYVVDPAADVGALVLGETSKCSNIVMEGGVTYWLNAEATNAVLKLIHEKEDLEEKCGHEKEKVLAGLETCERIRAEMAREREWKGVDPIRFTETIAAATERIIKAVMS